jgi:hypothetical protein
MYIPPAFSNISVHFIIHLIKEIKLLGPVFLHQMYVYERFNGILKSFVRNRAYPGGSMVQGYCTKEVVVWALNYVDPCNPIGVPKSHHVLQQMSIMSEYLDEHKEVLLRDNPGCNESWLVNELMRKFNGWVRDQISQV